MDRAIFLDKDGTLIEDLPYNVDPEKVVFLPGAWEGLALLQRAGFRLVIVTNQSGVARGYFTEADQERLSGFFAGCFRSHGLSLAGFYYCPHLPEGMVPGYDIMCACRKPKPGLILRAADDLDIDLGGSWYIGNIATDIEAGRRAGCRTVLLKADPAAPPAAVRPDITARDIAEAAAMIGRCQPRSLI
ncbi:MAG: D-glycero-alpha-D-manno-heptose-1,7-bisphosphate 7-phosphatase [Deltaproteobacteria bacterium]